jgi:hypothetical protein
MLKSWRRVRRLKAPSKAPVSGACLGEEAAAQKPDRRRPAAPQG